MTIQTKAFEEYFPVVLFIFYYSHTNEVCISFGGGGVNVNNLGTTWKIQIYCFPGNQDKEQIVILAF